MHSPLETQPWALPTVLWVLISPVLDTEAVSAKSLLAGSPEGKVKATLSIETVCCLGQEHGTMKGC